MSIDRATYWQLVVCVFSYWLQSSQTLHNETSESTIYAIEERNFTTVIPDEQRLYENLMDGYEKSVRPVRNSTTILLVKFALHLNQIIGLDERHQVLTTNVFIDQQWLDESLYWDPEDYNNIKSIRIPASNVWLPDTFIYNKYLYTTQWLPEDL